MMCIATFYSLVFILSSQIVNAETNNKFDVSVTVKEGQIGGFREKSLKGKEFYSFLSVPFAQPPTGSLRFKDPLPHKSWEGILDGTKMPQGCTQARIMDLVKENKSNMPIDGDEDCLYMNIFTPQPNAEEAKIPVMVYIHGGSFQRGNAAEHRAQVLLNEEIVLIVLQYRLGVLGFLSMEDNLMKGNMGLKDQQLALKWIQDNVIQFGGDPDRVTIFGESAGGASVHMQMLSPGSKGLFQRAILQSGTSLCPWAMSDNHKTYAIELGRSVGCFVTDGTEEFLKCLQAIHPKRFLQHTADTMIWGLEPLYVLPRVDGDFLPDRPEILLREGKYHKVDYMSGITKDEGTYVLYMFYANPTMMEKINNNFELTGPLSLRFATEKEPQKLALQVYRHYFKRQRINISMEDEYQLLKLLGDRYFGMCHDVAAAVHANDSDMSVYLYYLSHVGQYGFIDRVPQAGNKGWVSHVDDLFYLFSGGPFFSRPLEREEDLRLRDIIVTSWTNFAKTGNPTPPGSDFVWEKATTGSMKQLNLNPSPAMEKDNRSDIRKFWLSLKTKENFNLLDGKTKSLFDIESNVNSKEEL